MRFLNLLLPLLILSPFSSSRAEEKPWQEWFTQGIDGAEVRCGTATYQVVDGVLIGTTAEQSPNSFLVKGPFKDFELEFEVQVDDELNSGVQVRSHFFKGGDPLPEGSKYPERMTDGRLYGPQCEIAINGTAGDFYDEARQGVWWSEITGTKEKMRTPEAQAAFKKGEWNQYRILVKGDHYESYVNGVKTADFTQPGDPEGFIGFQVHSIPKETGPYTVRWRKIRFREL